MAEGRAGGHLVIWDSTGPHDSIDATFVDWNGYFEDEESVSLLRYVEENAEHLRERYLAWVDELGETLIGGRRLVDRMAVGSTGFSLWWMSSIVEKSFWNTPTMATVVRLLALDELVGREAPESVLVVSDCAEVRRAVHRLCRRRGVHCRSERAGSTPRWEGLRRWVVGSSPRPARALRALCDFAAKGRPVGGRRPRRWDDSSSSLFLLSCFGHLTPDEAVAGRFDSRYWQGLYEVFRDAEVATNWLHYFVTSSDVPDLATAATWLDELDANPDDQGNHALLESYASPRLHARSLGRWLGRVPSTFSLRALGRQGFGPDLHEVLWPVVREEWLDDLRGARSMHHQLWLAIFEAACGDLPTQRRGLYLYEGASWERAFVHAWRAAGHGELIGVPHATIRFWDLRYYVHPRTRDRTGPHALPQPDRLVRNNVTASAAFEAVDYPEARVVDCESLRYAHLIGIEASERWPSPEGPLRVLVLGEVRASAMLKMLRMLAETLPLLGFDVELALKAHPNSPVRTEDHPGLDLQMVGGPLSDLVDGFDVAFSSNGTSAGVDVLLAGLPVVVWLDEDDLNLSDLRGLPGVAFVGSPGDLAGSFRGIRTGEVRAPSAPAFFTLDAGLPRWRHLLAEVPTHRPRSQSEVLS